MMQKAISAPTVLTMDGMKQNHAVLINGDSISGIVPASEVPADYDHQQFSFGTLAPGFIDTQVNGGGGVLFNDAPTADTIRTMIEAHCRYGTTGMLPTLITDDLEKAETAIAAVNQALKEGVPGILGIHLEGPFLNKEQKGIHDGRKIQRLLPKHIELLSSLRGGKTLVTLAPEQTPPNLIEKLVERRVIASAGHTNATYEQMQEGLAAGITGFTHLFNAMSGFESRLPGTVGAAFTSSHTYASLIADGHHVHPASLKVALKTKGPGHCMIVTDSMSTVGSSQTAFTLNGECILLSDGKLTNDAGVLAGSALDMASAVRYMVTAVGANLETAVRMASQTPAEFLGLSDKYGSLGPGQAADMILLDNDVSVHMTIISGEMVFAA